MFYETVHYQPPAVAVPLTNTESSDSTHPHIELVQGILFN